MKPERILVCGGREFSDFNGLSRTLSECARFFAPDYVLIHGGARGADMLAHQWAFFQGCAVIRMDANWDYYGKRAGSLRNEWMLKYAKPDLVIAFPGGTGTKNMIDSATKAGVQVYAL